MRKYIVNGNFARALVRVLSLAVLFLSLALVPGCAGKTGSGADGGEAGEEADEKETAAVAESTASDIKGQAARIEEIIRTITARPHSTGTEGEKKVARYIETYLAELGYETRQMSFTQEPVRDSATALSGETVETGNNEYGDQTETVRYSIRWFGMDEPIPSDYYYRNGFLEEVDILYEKATGQTRQEAIESLSGFLGEPDYYGEKDGSETSWEDATYHKYTAVAPQEDGSYKVYVLDDNFGHDLKNSYSLGEEPSVLEQKVRETAENPEQDQKMLEMALQVVYPADRPMIELQMYTDGYHNSTGFTGGISYEDNTRMQLSLDVVDAFEEGTALWRDYNKFLKTAVHEYGHALAQNAAQVDITGQARTADDTMPPVMYDYEAFADDAYLRAFYERFWTELDVRSGLEYYKEAPEEFVDSYAATDMSEDFAETFALFVLGDRPSGNTVAEEKIRFFYDYEELTARRDFIRGNFELEN